MPNIVKATMYGTCAATDSWVATTTIVPITPTLKKTARPLPAHRVQLPLALLHAERAAERALGVIIDRIGRAEDGHHGVALELVDRPTVQEHHLGHGLEVAPDDRGDVAGGEPLGERREPTDV